MYKIHYNKINNMNAEKKENYAFNKIKIVNYVFDSNLFMNFRMKRTAKRWSQAGEEILFTFIEKNK